MKQFILITMGLFALFSCSKKNDLTKDEIDLLNKINFEAELIAEIKQETKNDVRQLPAVDQETGEFISGKTFDGVYLEINSNNPEEYIKILKPKFRDKGFLVFLFDGENGKKLIGVIKGTDDLDILRYRRTDGINYDLVNEDIVSKISDWKSKYGLIIIGCSQDWLQIEFDTLPLNIDEFATEVYEFCPDSVDQGVGTVEKLKQAIVEMKGLWLWWD
jgi:hypothetical protein